MWDVLQDVGRYTDLSTVSKLSPGTCGATEELHTGACPYLVLLGSGAPRCSSPIVDKIVPWSWVLTVAQCSATIL